MWPPNGEFGKAGVSANVEQRLRKGKVLEELLKQDQNSPIPMPFILKVPLTRKLLCWLFAVWITL